MAISGSNKGIGRSVRDYLTGGENGRPTPNPQAQNMMFMVGIVMDDSDDHSMGRVWVYIPTHSSKRFGDHSTTDYGGTVPDRQTGRLVLDAELRTGWIPCYPLLAYAGTDFNRVSNSPTGRNGREGGHSSSYGMWYQPRIGDHVGVLFDHADPAQGYWIGCVPRFYSNFSMPSVSGVRKDTISEELNTSIFNQVPEDGLVPSLEKINEEGANQRFRDTFAATDFANNLLDAGLISDPLRGAGVSSARRESPSYVVGMKSPGWDFDSEKHNFNVETGLKFDGTRVGTSPSVTTSNVYRNISTVGHQFVMDDHPNYQGVRLRTSAGSQIYFNDTSATEPFIYISTAKGNVWLELRDDGKIDVFAEDDISFHAQGDINFVADGDMNLEVGGRMRTAVKGNQELRVDGTTSWEMNSAFSLTAQESMNVEVIGDFIQQSTGEASFGTESGSVYVESNGAVNVNSDSSVAITAIQGMDILSTTGMSIQSLSGISLNGGGEVRAQAGAIWLNSGAGPGAIPASSGLSPNTIEQSELNSAPGAPTEEETRTGELPDPVSTLATRLPQHQPWSLRSDKTGGFSGFIEENDEDPTAPQGAARDNANSPLNYVGYLDGSDEPRNYRGREYQTDSLAESPQYDDLGDPASGELVSVDDLNASERLVKYLHTKEGLVTRSAYLDAGVAWAIGYGHNIKVGDVINGTLSEGGRTRTGEFRVDSEFISALYRTEGLGLSITRDEADRIFREDLSFFEEAVRRSVQVDITQGQFDALVSITYNIGEGNLKRSSFLRNINSKNFQEVPRNWRLWNKSRDASGALAFNSGLDRRRQEELEFFWAKTA